LVMILRRAFDATISGEFEEHRRCVPSALITSPFLPWQVCWRSGGSMPQSLMCMSPITMVSPSMTRAVLRDRRRWRNC
jgi:hypothetical protein